MLQVCYLQHVRQLHMEDSILVAAHLLGVYDSAATLAQRKVRLHTSDSLDAAQTAAAHNTAAALAQHKVCLLYSISHNATQIADRSLANAWEAQPCSCW